MKTTRTAQHDVKDEMEEPEKKDGQGNAHDRRHDEPGPAQRLGMVHAVDEEEDALQPFRLRMIMEEEPVHEILDKRPDEPAGQ